jgi:integrase
VVRLEDGERGLSARTIKRRLSSVAGFYGYLLYREDTGVERSPVPRGLPTRRASHHQGGSVTPLIRTPRTLPRVVMPQEATALLEGLRTRRDEAMILAMLLGGLRRGEVLGLRLEDVRLGERRLFIADGKGGHQRLVSISPRFLEALGEYLDLERPSEATTDRVFVALRGPRRGRPLSAAGLDDVMTAACRRAGLPRRVTCHQLRHTCLTRLREGGMALEAVQAQAGHRSIETTKLYLHLADGWVAEEYWKALTAIDGDASASVR